MEILTLRSNSAASGFHRFWTNFRHGSMPFNVVVRAGDLTGIKEGLLEPVAPETAFRRRRPAVVGRDAPRIDSGSEGPA